MSLLNIQRSYVPFELGSFMQEVKTSRIEMGVHFKEVLRAHNSANTGPVEKIDVHTRQVLLGSELETRAR